jgi:2-polyprenyl-3-methyl-5-hydroxy-6-metoxy-1,4-benzoquinol methylase
MSDRTLPADEPSNSVQQVTVAQTRKIWDEIARWWDEQIGEGNDFQKTLIIPATDRLLAPQKGEAILDIACGSGNYARHLARLGAEVTACDFSEKFLQCALQRQTPDTASIRYVKIDATDSGQLRSLGERRFDAAVCSMSMMDMPTIDPLLGAIPAHLKPGGRFVFSLPHPCFNSAEMKFTAELVLFGGQAHQNFGVEVHKYLSQGALLSVGITNQPRPHYFFHRPLSAIFQSCFAAKLGIDGVEEPAYPPGSPKNVFSWMKRPELPPAIVLRVRPMSASTQAETAAK